jgi:cobalt-precorrin 5A hydrolase
VFDGLADAVAREFHRFEGHVFIMATGIVVRTIAPHLRGKTEDPAVVVVDDRGRFAISLVSGHVGGANRLARQTADLLGATPVITTATDIHGKPAVDLVAARRGLFIQNPGRIKAVNMALLADAPVAVHDPGGWLGNRLPGATPLAVGDAGAGADDPPVVWVDDGARSPDSHILVLRPPSLVAGIGCNRGTRRKELREFLLRTLQAFALAMESLWTLASIDLKADEAGLRALAAELDRPILFFNREELSGVEDVTSPSALVNHHVGVPSVCEAAALLAGRRGGHRCRLIVPKQISGNVTLAIARRDCMSSD